MPNDDTRRVLKIFGVAVTEFEDAVRNNSTSVEEIRKREAEARARLQEVTALIEGLSAAASRPFK